jgi:hypothetical protein
MRFISILSSANSVPKTRQFVGLPPELKGGKDTRQEMGAAYFLTIEEEADQIFLYRFGKDGVCVGDTWHRNVDEAKEQALYEYGDAVGQWTDVPPDQKDMGAFGLEQMRSRT